MRDDIIYIHSFKAVWLCHDEYNHNERLPFKLGGAFDVWQTQEWKQHGGKSKCIGKMEWGTGMNGESE